MSYCIVWEFEVPEAGRPDFEAAYGPEGPWAHLFAKAAGFRDVKLFRSCERPGRYFTVDRWVSEAAFRAFRQDFASEYEVLDRRFEGLTGKETRIDAVTEIA